MLEFYLREEYRHHIYIAKKFSLLIFPAYVFLSSLFASYFSTYIFSIFSYANFIKLMLISTLLYGFGVSSFEFLGRSGEKGSLLTISSLLPISPRKSYFYAFLRDIIYYSSLFILPLYLGLLAGTLISSLTVSQVSIFVLSLFVSMLIGYSLGYLSFALEGRSRLLYLIFIVSFLLYVLLFLLNIVPFTVELFQRGKESLWLGISIIVVASLIPAAYFLTPLERRRSERRRNFRYLLYLRIFHKPLLAKIMEDAVRGGVVYKSVLTYFFPMLLLFLFIRLINMAMNTQIYNSLSLSLMLSLFSVVIYSWLTVIEDFGYFQTLPFTASEIIYALIHVHIILISVISLPILIIFNVATPTLIFPSIALFYLTSLYLISLTANLSGYRINSMLFNPGIVLRFSIYTLIPGMILLVASTEISLLSIITMGITAGAMILVIIRNFRKIKEKWKYF